MSQLVVTVIGGGFAGVEAAWAAANRGVSVRLFEMRPAKQTPAHQTDRLAELVCSNSFKSALPTSPSGHLKWEMEQLGSIVVPAARKHSVSAGEALAVDRDAFSAHVTELIAVHPGIEVVREEAASIPDGGVTVIATGPLTSEAFVNEIARVTGRARLFFYDAVSPTVDASTVDFSRAFRQSRYDKGSGDDYINCPFTKEEYEAFVKAVLAAELAPLHEFEDARFFEGCLPLEEIARRGERSLAFGPFKPVGLTDPKTGRRPYAVLQLRPENREGTLYSLVACQTRMRWGAQKEVFRMAPGLAAAEFVRLGVIHRNTYLDSPRLLDPTLQLRAEPRLLFAGQLVGVEGYLESAAAGIVAGINAAAVARDEPPLTLPRATVLGSLLDYVATCPSDRFAPMNANWGLLPDPVPSLKDKGARRAAKLENARTALMAMLGEYPTTCVTR